MISFRDRIVSADDSVASLSTEASSSLPIKIPSRVGLKCTQISSEPISPRRYRHLGNPALPNFSRALSKSSLRHSDFPISRSVSARSLASYGRDSSRLNLQSFNATGALPLGAHAHAAEQDEEEDCIFAIQKHGSLHFVCGPAEALPSWSASSSLKKRSNSLSVVDRASESGIMWKFTYGNADTEAPRYRKMTMSEYKLKRQIMEGHYTEDMIRKTDDVPEEERTTVMLRNLPNKYTREHILNLLHEYEYGEHFDFFYMPIDFRSKSNVGYCFINFVNPEEAAEFKKLFAGFSDWKLNSVKKCQVSWSQPFQGLAAHVDRYRNSPVMHGTVPAEYQPCLYRNGEPVVFPGPLKKVEAPKLRRGKRNPVKAT